ncbi:MAG: hypothetical protein IID49_05375 [Proteobacteria bacterium]|nr:hypothetical protein [Pseudomonadota bacterium]
MHPGVAQGRQTGYNSNPPPLPRLSGAGAEGATPRVYLERFEPDPAHHGLDPRRALARVIAAASAISMGHYQ